MAPLIAVVFAAAGGWHVGAGPVHACPGVPPTRCVQVASWAATVRWRDCAECLPHKTIASLPPNGVALQVSLSRERLGGKKPFLVWPPHIRTQDLSGIEGVSDRYGVYQRFARVGNDEYAYVWAFFGRAHPTAGQLARANAELATTSVR